MSDLITRLEALTGPCRECDTLIYWEGNLPDDVTLSDIHLADQYDDCPVPAYTASIDAAMTLVPEGHAAAIGTMFGMPQLPWACVWTPQGEPKYRGDASTAAIALCIAALKARQ